MTGLNTPYARLDARASANAALSKFCELLAGDPFSPSVNRTETAMLRFVVREMRKLGYGCADSTDGESITIEDSLTGDWMKLVYGSSTRPDGFDYWGSKFDAESMLAECPEGYS